MRKAETFSHLGRNVLPVFHQKREKTAEYPQRGLPVEHTVLRNNAWNSPFRSHSTRVVELGCREMLHWVWQSHRDGDEYGKVFFSYTASSGVAARNTGGIFPQ